MMMRQPDFAGVRIKVERAKHQFSDLQAQYERFQEVQPYRVVTEDEPLDVMEHALDGLGYVVSYWYYRLCFPFAIAEPHARRLDQMDVGWGFSNLSGAVFWHLFQFLGAQSRIARCKQCGTVIPNAHKNTKFCRNNKECANAYYYEHVTQPERDRRVSSKS
jgi:hypothetical protein